MKHVNINSNKNNNNSNRVWSIFINNNKTHLTANHNKQQFKRIDKKKTTAWKATAGRRRKTQTYKTEEKSKTEQQTSNKKE